MKRRAFTLVEMLVALAVLVIAMAVVSGVFATTTRTASTTSALTEVQSAVRTFAEQIEEDLRGIDPTHSVLILQGRKQAAALTPEQREAGQYWRVFVGDSTVTGFNNYVARNDNTPEDSAGPATPRAQYSDPRADILAFFSQDGIASRCPPTESPGTPSATDARGNFRRSVARGAKVAPYLAVYGHCSLVEPTRDAAGNWVFPAAGNTLRHIESANPRQQISQIPASQWILGGRRTLIDDDTAFGVSQPLAFGGNGTQVPGANSGEGGEFTRILRCYSGDAAGNGGSNVYIGDGATFPLAAYLSGLSANTVVGRRLIRAYPYGPSNPPGMPLSWTASDLQDFVWGLLYPGGSQTLHHVATALREPPPELQSNLGLQALRGCAWFQVELLLPEDPRNAVDHPLAAQRNDMPRWVEIPHGETFVFVPDSDENRALVLADIDLNTGQPLNGSRLNSFAQVVPPGVQTPPGSQNSAANRHVRLWPYAIRITIRAIDEKNRLAEPIVRTIVHRFD